MKKNLPRHYKLVHKKVLTGNPCVLISPTEGIYLVANSSSGNPHPVHCQVRVTIAVQIFTCENNICIEAMKAYQRRNVGMFSCKHFQSINYFSIPPKQHQILEENIDAAVKESIIGETSAAQVKRLLCTVRSLEVPLAVHWNPNPGCNKFLYVSVYDCQKKYYSRLGCTVVRCNETSAKLDCSCSVKHHSCLHRAVARIHIRINLPHILHSDMGDKNALKDDKLDRPKSIESKRMKTIPCEIRIFFSDTFPSHIYPKESECRYCSLKPKLSSPEIGTSAAKIYDLNCCVKGKLLWSCGIQ